MKVTIREGVFETNSSSTHALVIKNKSYEANNKRLNGRKISGGYYGWSEKILKTPAKKLAYIYTEACLLKAYDNNTVLFDNLHSAFPKTEFIEPEISIRYNIPDDPSSGIESLDVENMYIDHDEELTEMRQLFESNIPILKAFVYNDDNIIITGNDDSVNDVYDHAMEIAGPNGQVIYKGN